MTVRLMSDVELGRLEVLKDLDRRRLTVAAAAQLLGLERRQVFRLLKAYRIDGATGLISKRRGRPSNRRKPKELRTKALTIIGEQYWDFGPTLAAEKLREAHQIVLAGRRQVDDVALDQAANAMAGSEDAEARIQPARRDDRTAKRLIDHGGGTAALRDDERPHRCSSAGFWHNAGSEG